MIVEQEVLPRWRPSIRPLRLLLAAVAVTALAAAGFLIPLLDQPLLILVPAVAAPALALAVRRFDLAIYALIAATAMNGYNFTIAGWNAKIENVAVLLALAALIWLIASRRERTQPLPLILLFGSLLAVNAVSSIFNSPDLYKSARIIVRMGFAIATMYVISTYVSDRGRLLAGLRALLVVGATASAFGIIALVVWRYFGQNVGVQRDPITGAMSVKGTLWEGNIFGSYAAGIATLSGGLLLSKVRVVGRGLLAIVFVLAIIALMLSLTRAAWLGFGAGAVLVVLFLRGARLPTVLLVAGLAIMATFVVLKFEVGGTRQDISDRITTLSAMRTDATSLSRLHNVDRALEEWQESPILGSGTDSFHLNHPKITSTLPSPELTALYDTGLIGFAVFLATVGSLFLRCVLSANRHLDDDLTTLLGALTIAAIVQLVAFQATDAFWLGFIWVYFGLMLAASRLITEGGQMREMAVPALVRTG
jgi:O-antigen ligase